MTIWMLKRASGRLSLRRTSLLAAISFAAAISTSRHCEAQQQPDAHPYVQQLETTAEDVRSGYQSFLEDLQRVGPRQERLRRLSEEPKEGAGMHRPLQDPPAVRPEHGVLEHTLVVDYGENHVYNVKQDRNLKVRLRSYNERLFGRTLRIRPGDQLSIPIENRLPADHVRHGGVNTPHRFNTTNLHTHGLHVSPAGNSDNVLIALPPGASFQNEIHVPRDHPPGTFWYHAHVHGSTAIQTTSGMAGVLIIEGGLDEAPKVKDAVEHILIFQQMPYVVADGSEDVYVIEDYDHFGPKQWEDGVNRRGWRTTINGQTQPVIGLRPGEVQRWRMIHAAFRERVDVSLVPLGVAQETMRRAAARTADAGERREDALAEAASRRAVQGRREAVLQEAIPLHEIAADGLAYGFDWTRESIELQPGYRSDVLVKIDKPGTYVLMDNEVSAEDALWRRYESPKVLAIVEVSGAPQEMPLPTNDDLAQYRPHPSVADDEVVENGTGAKRLQKVEFNIDLDFRPPQFQINSQPYDPGARPRTLELGKAYEWILTSRFANHPFHIHVNPFEIIQWNDEEGDSRLPLIDGQRRTIWKDTILVKQNAGNTEAQKIRVRARNERYIGRFVLHCHILDHEDQGMMQDVEVLPPGDAHH